MALVRRILGDAQVSETVLSRASASTRGCYRYGISDMIWIRKKE